MSSSRPNRTHGVDVIYLLLVIIHTNLPFFLVKLYTNLLNDLYERKSLVETIHINEQKVLVLIGAHGYNNLESMVIKEAESIMFLKKADKARRDI